VGFYVTAAVQALALHGQQQTRQQPQQQQQLQQQQQVHSMFLKTPHVAPPSSAPPSSAPPQQQQQPAFIFVKFELLSPAASSSTPSSSSSSSSSSLTFAANCPFNPDVVAVFKTIDGRSYDGAKRRWAFPLHAHDALLRALKALRSVAVDVARLESSALAAMGINPAILTRGAEDSAASSAPPYAPPYAPPSSSASAKLEPPHGAAGVTMECESEVQRRLTLVSPELRESLLPFQRDGVLFALRRGGRLLIGDEMGLGKTVQALAVACAYPESWPVLIVCPSSMRLTWKAELLRWVPSIDEGCVSVLMHVADAKGLSSAVSPPSKSKSKPDMAATPPRTLFTITSYDIFTRVDGNVGWHGVVIADESHSLKSGVSKRCKLLQPVLKKAKRCILLSGTPMLSKPIELYPQICCVAPKLFPNKREFCVRYCNGRDMPWGFEAKVPPP
jgi:SWI/SNF-related matrix-associated actin-dependent regulator of chromatin subfamily A-like protein 1